MDITPESIYKVLKDLFLEINSIANGYSASIGKEAEKKEFGWENFIMGSIQNNWCFMLSPHCFHSFKSKFQLKEEDI